MVLHNNNPARVANRERKLIWPEAFEEDPDILLSLGTGQNRISVLRHQTASSWRLVATKQQVPLSDVRGRWYESLRMLPIINPGLYQQALNAGQIPDVGRSLNARGDSGVLEGGSPGYRFSHREAVLGGSVPAGFNLPSIRGLGDGNGGSGRGTPVGRGSDVMDLDGQSGFTG